MEALVEAATNRAKADATERCRRLFFEEVARIDADANEAAARALQRLAKEGQEQITCELCCESAGGLQVWKQASVEARNLLLRHSEERPKCQVHNFCPDCILRHVKSFEEDPARQPDKCGSKRSGACCPLCRFELRKPCVKSELVRAAKRFQMDAEQFHHAFVAKNGAHRTDRDSAERVLEVMIHRRERRQKMLSAVSNRKDYDQASDQWLNEVRMQVALDDRTLLQLARLAP